MENRSPRAVSRLERGVKWVRKHPLTTSLTTVILLLAITGTVGVLWAYNLALESNSQLKAERNQVLELNEQLKKQLYLVNRMMYVDHLKKVGQLVEEDRDRAYTMLLDTRLFPINMRSATWNFYANYCKRKKLTLSKMDDLLCHSVAFSPDGRTLATGCVRNEQNENDLRQAKNELNLWDVKTGLKTATLHGNHSGAISSVAFSPDGRTLAAGNFETVQLWDLRTGKETVTLRGHTGYVSSVVFSPDGRTLASAGYEDKLLKLWDLGTGLETANLCGHKGSVWSVAFSPDGRTLVSGSGTTDFDVKVRGNEIKLWDVKTGLETASIRGFNEAVRSVAFNPDGRTLAACSGAFVKLWDVKTGLKTATLFGHTNYVRVVAFSPDGRTLASGYRVNDFDPRVEIKLWNVKTGEESAILKTADTLISSVAFSPDGRTLASNSGYNVLLFDVANDGKETATLRESNRGLKFSRDGQVLATFGSSHTVKLWDVGTGLEFATLHGHNRSVNSVAFSPDGRTLAIGCIRIERNEHSGLRQAKNEIKLWDIKTGKETATLGSGKFGTYGSVGFSPDGRTLFSLGPFSNSALRLWNVETGQETTLKISGWVESVAFSPDGRTLAMGCGIEKWEKNRFGEKIKRVRNKSEIRLWDVKTGKETATLNVSKNYAEIRSLEFNPDGRTLLANGTVWNLETGNTTLWDLETGKETANLSGTNNSVGFSPDGRNLFSISRVNETDVVKLWDVETGLETATLSGFSSRVNSVAFSPDSRTLASATGRMVKLWDVETGLETAALGGISSFVESVAFSPDGRTLAATTHSEVILWDVGTGPEIAIIRGHRDRLIGAVAVSPDGRTLASASGNKSHDLKLWDLATGQETATLYTNVGQDDYSLAFSKDSSKVRLKGKDKTQIWDVKTGKQLSNNPQHIFVDSSDRIGNGRWQVKVDSRIRIVILLDKNLASKQTKWQKHFEWKEREAPYWHENQAQEAKNARQSFAHAYHLGKLANFRPWDAEARQHEALVWHKADQPARSAIATVQHALNVTNPWLRVVELERMPRDTFQKK